MTRSLHPKKYHNYDIDWYTVFLIVWILFFFGISIVVVSSAARLNGY